MPKEDQSHFYLPTVEPRRWRRKIRRLVRGITLALLVVGLMLGVIALWDYLASYDF